MVRCCQNIFVEFWIALSNLRALNNPRQAAGPESSLRVLTLTCLKRKTNRLGFNHLKISGLNLIVIYSKILNFAHTNSCDKLKLKLTKKLKLTQTDLD